MQFRFHYLHRRRRLPRAASSATTSPSPRTARPLLHRRRRGRHRLDPRRVQRSSAPAYTDAYDNYYIAGNRAYVSYDKYLKTGPYIFGYRAPQAGLGGALHVPAGSADLVLGHLAGRQQHQRPPGSGSQPLHRLAPAADLQPERRPVARPGPGLRRSVQPAARPTRSRCTSTASRSTSAARTRSRSSTTPRSTSTTSCRTTGVKLPAVGVKIRVLERERHLDEGPHLRIADDPHDPAPRAFAPGRRRVRGRNPPGDRPRRRANPRRRGGTDAGAATSNRHDGETDDRRRRCGAAATPAPAGRRHRRAPGRPRRRMRHGREGDIVPEESPPTASAPGASGPVPAPSPTGPAGGPVSSAGRPPSTTPPPGLPRPSSPPKTPTDVTSPGWVGGTVTARRHRPLLRPGHRRRTGVRPLQRPGLDPGQGRPHPGLVEPNPLRIDCGPGQHVRLVKFSKVG